LSSPQPPGRPLQVPPPAASRLAGGLREAINPLKLARKMVRIGRQLANGGGG
jgi:hypothetical protein